MPATAVGFRHLATQPSATAELAEDPAQVGHVELQIVRDLAGRDIGARGELVQHARFGQRQLAAQEALVEQAELARVQAIEIRIAAMVPVPRRPRAAEVPLVMAGSSEI
jgi:hypothetical protein